MIAAAITNLGVVSLATACWHHGWGPWFLLVPLLWVLAIIVIVRLARGCPPWRGGRHHAHRRESGAEVLERRLAQGEIDPEEYRRRRSVLDEDG